MGQHFLTDASVAEKTARALHVGVEYDSVIEVGPGAGILTRFLLEEQNLFLVELDRTLVPELKKKFPALADKIVEADFLRIDLHDITRSDSIAIVGNFPYNISSQIVFKAIDNREKVPLVVGMFQREMAQRIVSPEGSKVYGVISVLTQAYYEAEYLFDVPPDRFDPPPKVWSGVIRLKRREQLNLGCNEKLFKQVVKQAFNQRRKTMRNSLKGLLPPGFPEDDPILPLRPEQLSVNAFIDLTNRIESLR